MTDAVEKVGSLFFLALSTGYLIVATQLPAESPNLSDMGPRVYPLILGIVLTGLSALWVTMTLRTRGGAETAEQAQSPLAGHSLARVGALLLANVAFPVVLQQFGFLLTASLVLFASSMVIRWRRPDLRSVVLSAVFAFGCALGLKLLLSDVMSIYLP